MSNSNCTLVTGVLRCQCVSGRIYSIMSGGCIIPIQYNQSCKATADCVNNLVCTSVNGASYCLCGTDTRYYSALNATCLDKALFNQPCTSLGPYCDDGRGLQCSAFGNCTCGTSDYYSTTDGRCTARIFPGNTCAVTTSCIVNANCVSSICRCINGSFYYDITTGQCVALKSYGTSCSEHEQCQLSLYCISGICQCLSTQYYNASSTTCTTSATLGASCSSSSGLYCNTFAGLICSLTTSTCDCPTNYYWNGTKCLLKSNLYDSCTAATQCPTSGVCTTSICQCTSATTYYNSTINSCVVYSTYGQVCVANSFVTDECSSALNLVCSSTTSGLCQCQSSFYFDSGTSSCVTKATDSAACSATILCNDLAGLICSTTCTCSTGSFWGGTTCVETLGAGQTCASVPQCTSPLTCSGATCSCPAGLYLDWITVRCLTNKISGSACTYGFECSSGTCTNSICT